MRSHNNLKVFINGQKREVDENGEVYGSSTFNLNITHNTQPLIPANSIVNKAVTIQQEYKGPVFFGSVDEIIARCNQQADEKKSNETSTFRNNK